MFAIGFFASLYIGITKLIKLYNHEPTILVTDNPWFYIALTAMMIGSQLFLAGFLGELITRSKNQEKRYSVSKQINF
jgi:hypothetical protein